MIEANSMHTILNYIREQLQLTKDQKTYTDWETARKEGAMGVLEDILEQFPNNDTEGARAKIELLYNGDYPGSACVRVADNWLNAEEKALLCKMFNVAQLPELYDKVGLSKNWNGTISEEHKPFEGYIAILQ
jgi:hypothetical protein